MAVIGHRRKTIGATVPSTQNNPDTLDYEDYGYRDEEGRFHFYQGYDMKFKSRLMRESRAVPKTSQSDRAMKELARRGWSTPQREKAAREAARKKRQRVA
jgi:hypothetical protein